jgi:hypothetical protein
MTDVEKLTFGELERDRIIRADWGSWHPSLCDQRDQLGSDANPETTLCMRLFLRSDTKQEKAERKGWPNKLLRFKNTQVPKSKRMHTRVVRVHLHAARAAPVKHRARQSS